MTVETISAGITAIGVCFAAWQIRQNRELARTEFEDRLDTQYRSVIQEIPADVFLEKELGTSHQHFREMIFNYFDLSNEQVFLRMQGRISDSRWECWREGIRDNMSLKTIRELWKEVKEHDKSTDKKIFTLLSRLEACDYKDDPINW